MIFDSDEINYALQALTDLGAVRRGEKPLVIISSGKSTKAYELASEMAMSDDELDFDHAMFVCEDGALHEMVFICRMGAPYAREATELVFERDARKISRFTLQIRLGSLLGYPAAKIVEFTKSEQGKTCPCDLCGGEVLPDQNQIRRTMFHNTPDHAISV
jgi:hypothetical protein